MPGPDLPEIPAQLKSVQHYLKIASTHDERDRVVSYWCRLYALQTGLKLSTKTQKATNFLLKLMDWLEATKKELHDNEAITNDIAAQAHLENWALKLFLYADQNDRAGNFGKSVIQSFYTAGLLYDVLTFFGELSEEAMQNRKYAKWKASYIHNCLKNGETPVPGPVQDGDMDMADDEGGHEENEDADGVGESEGNEATGGFDFPSVPSHSSADRPADETENSNPSSPTSEMEHKFVPGLPASGPSVSSTNLSYNTITNSDTGIELTMKQLAKAQKYTKWAGSALNYDDVPTAITNLQKALHLLTTGQDVA